MDSILVCKSSLQTVVSLIIIVIHTKMQSNVIGIQNIQISTKRMQSQA